MAPGTNTPQGLPPRRIVLATQRDAYSLRIRGRSFHIVYKTVDQLVREFMMIEADLIPDYDNGTLTVRLHHLTNRISDQAERHLAQHLNEAETTSPYTNLRLIYKLVSDDNPLDQES